MYSKPTLVLDEAKCKRNIEKMVSKAKAHGLIFRPHFKTHQSLQIGRWFKDEGVERIAVSSVSMAGYFAEDWNDITIAFPVNILEIDEINELANRITLNLLVENIETSAFLAENLKTKVGVFIKIDVGYHRTGINPSDTDLIDNILEIVNSSSLLAFKGFLSHAGHTYKCKSIDEIKTVHDGAVKVMQDLKDIYLCRYPQLVVSLGDTPGCSIADNFSGVDEMRPGNFVFYDLMQYQLGACPISQIAVALACPIVAKHKSRSEIVVYGGGVHFSKERLENEVEGTIYGRVVEKLVKGWGNIIPGMFVKSLSQEHGIVEVPRALFEKYKIGEHLLILPVHSCLTANLLKSYKTTDGLMLE